MDAVTLHWPEAIKLLLDCLPECCGIIEKPEDLNFDSVMSVLCSGLRKAERLRMVERQTDGEAVLSALTAAGFHLSGDLLIIPDCGDLAKPAVQCSAEALVQTVDDYESPETGWGLLDGCSDVLIITDSGGAIFIDHDEHWWKSWTIK